MARHLWPVCAVLLNARARALDFEIYVSIENKGDVAMDDRDGFNAAFRECPVVRYLRDDKPYAFYRRLTAVPPTFDAYSVFVETWTEKDNRLNKDFEIVSTTEELINASPDARWLFCNFDDRGIGFPRDCGPKKKVMSRWFALPPDRGGRGMYQQYSLTLSASLSVATPDDCPSLGPFRALYTFEGAEWWENKARPGMNDLPSGGKRVGTNDQVVCGGGALQLGLDEIAQVKPADVVGAPKKETWSLGFWVRYKKGQGERVFFHVGAANRFAMHGTGFDIGVHPPDRGFAELYVHDRRNAEDLGYAIPVGDDVPWTHLAAVYDGAVTTFYVNHVPLETTLDVRWKFKYDDILGGIIVGDYRGGDRGNARNGVWLFDQIDFVQGIKLPEELQCQRGPGGPVVPASVDVQVNTPDPTRCDVSLMGDTTLAVHLTTTPDRAVTVSFEVKFSDGSDASDLVEVNPIEVELTDSEAHIVDILLAADVVGSDSEFFVEATVTSEDVDYKYLQAPLVPDGLVCTGSIVGDTPAPPTPEPSTIAPATPAPTTIAPPTPAPSTIASPTPEPTTVAPATPAPSTIAPPTPEPTTIASPTPEPSIIAPPTPEPSTIAPLTPEPSTFAPATPEPSTIAPPTPEPSTIAPATPEPSTIAPPTPEPSTITPPTPDPSTIAPPTPEPSTIAPLTPEPSTFAPATPEPSTIAPPTPEPSTIAPPTPEPSTIAPPTPEPSTIAPLTPEPSTFAPATPEPSTIAPPTPEPSTIAPATPEPSTIAPPTPEPSTIASPTPEPSTIAPPTPEPSTIAPPTPEPSTIAPPTPEPSTFAPATPEPSTIAPPTPEPSTIAPPTPAPSLGPALMTPEPTTLAPATRPDERLAGPSAAALGEVRSDVINSGGVALPFAAIAPLYAGGVRGRAVATVVLGPGDAAPASDGEPRVVVRSSRGADEASSGLVATARARGEAVRASVSDDGAVLTVWLEDEGYMTVASEAEVLTVELSPALFEPAVAGGVGVRGSVCTVGECVYQVPVVPQTPRMAAQEEVAAQTAAVAATMGVMSFVAPAATAGPNAGLLALSSRAMLCPSIGGGPEKLDRTLNPLGLAYGASFEDYNGAVVGALLIVLGVVAACAVYALWVSRQMQQRLDDVDDDGEDGLARAIDMNYVLMQARFGWLLIPFGFLYGGAVIGALTSVIYSSTAFRLLGCVLFIGFVGTLPAYAAVTARRCTAWCAYAAVDAGEAGGAVRRFFWGDHAWAPREDVRGSYAWNGLHRLVYDAYKPRYRYFLCVQLGAVLVMGALSAWQPRTRDECWSRTGAMTAVLGVLTCVLVGARPFVAPYENVLESAICVLETLMMGATLAAMGAENPSKHWGAAAAGRLALGTVWCILVKFVVDVVVFVIDEYGEWKGSRGAGAGGVGAFALHMVCCGSVGGGHAYYRQVDAAAGDSFSKGFGTLRAEGASSESIAPMEGLSFNEELAPTPCSAPVQYGQGTSGTGDVSMKSLGGRGGAGGVWRDGRYSVPRGPHRGPHAAGRGLQQASSSLHSSRELGSPRSAQRVRALTPLSTRRLESPILRIV